jgi:predicted transposase/invertase (TIGR01784 family)
MSQWSREEQTSFLQQRMAEQDRREVEYVRQRKARLEGKEEGLQEGLQAGLEKAKLQIAAAMLAAGMQPDQIAQMTGLSTDKISASSFGQTVAARKAPSEPITTELQPAKKRGTTRKP